MTGLSSGIVIFLIVIFFFILWSITQTQVQTFLYHRNFILLNDVFYKITVLGRISIDKMKQS